MQSLELVLSYVFTTYAQSIFQVLITIHLKFLTVMFGQLSLSSSSRYQNVTKIFPAGVFVVVVVVFFNFVAGRITCMYNIHAIH